MLIGLLLLAILALTLLLIRARRMAASAREAVGGEMARLSDQLESSRRLLGQTDRLSAIGMLAASVAHEVRNPLVSVRTFIQLAPERLNDEEFRTRFRDLALGEIDRISLLVNDLLAFARPSTREANATDINEMLGQIRRLVDGEAKKCAVELSIELDATLPSVSVDEARIKQVFLNVVLNAIQACGSGGSVTLSTRSTRIDHRSYLQVEARDSGEGIAAADVERIFDPFFTTKERGSGLGLFIARRIVRDHGGDIEVESTPGTGTVFRLNFPLPTSTHVASPDAGGDDVDDRPHRPIAHG